MKNNFNLCYNKRIECIALLVLFNEFLVFKISKEPEDILEFLLLFFVVFSSIISIFLYQIIVTHQNIVSKFIPIIDSNYIFFMNI